MKEINFLLKGIFDSEGFFWYVFIKWSIKEVIGYIVDIECIMVYCLLFIVWGEIVEFLGYNDDMYVFKVVFDK